MAETIGIDIVARLDRFQAELERIPDIGGKQAKALAGQLSREIRAAERAVKASVGNMDREAAARFGKIKTASEKVFGGIVGDVADVAEGITALGPVAGAAAVGLLAIGGAAVGVAAVGAAVVGLVAGSADLLAELDKVGAASFVTDEQRDQVEAADAAIKGIKTNTQQLALILGIEFAPAVEDASLAVLGLMAALRDNKEDVLDAAGTTIHVLASTFLPNLTAAFDLASAGADALGVSTDDLTAGLTAAGDAEREALRRAELRAKLMAALTEGTDKATTATNRNTSATDANAAAQRAAEQALTQLQGAALAAQIEAADPMTRINLKLVEQVQRYDDLAVQAGSTAEAVELAEQAKADAVATATAETAALIDRQAADLAKVRETAAAAAAALAEQSAADAARLRSAWRDTAADVSGALAGLVTLAADSSATAAADSLAALEATGDATEVELANAKRAATERAKSAKAAAVLETTVNAAAAISKAATAAPPPLNIPGIVAMSALGATQIAAAATAPLPTFHAGGMVGAAATAPDESLAKVKSGEGVLTASGVRAIGGPTALDRANRGEATAVTATTVLMLRHRAIDQVSAEAYNRRGDLHRAISGGDRVGRSTRRR